MQAIKLNPITSGITPCIEYIKSLKNATIIIGCSTDFVKSKIDIILRENKLYSKSIEKFTEVKNAKSGLFLANLKLNDSFIHNKIYFIPDEVFIGKKLASNDFEIKRARINANRNKTIEIGSYIIHKQYGIGIFNGTELISTNGIVHECIKITYAENNILYVPIGHINQIKLYEKQSDENGTVKLDNLGSKSWQSRKKHSESKIQEMAFKIIKIAAERKRSVGKIYDHKLFLEEIKTLENDFPYIETEDQLKAIDSVYTDLSSGRIMNRLICGDVGFGKTEIAVRSSFLVMCGKLCKKEYSQVAMICPSVFLANQHYETCSKRFAKFGLRVELLSRFINHKKAIQIKEDLASGKIDMIIGTHALLQDHISFKNLGLIICDEEQMFGVAHKEKLKTLSKNTHLLTITATPIPRTLQFALYGITDISILTTAPFGRSVIKTDFLNFSKEALHDIFLKEKAQGGQSIIITPKIADINEIIRKMHEILPNLSIGSIHSNYSEKELNIIINNFYDGKYDIIVATTIIATGMDFSNSNTIIINKPEYFGLGQLYQIRGRVGRRDKQAYCYLLTDERIMANKDIMKRLFMLQSFNYSGSSFSIASADLDIRGAGNLLGKDQSGVISEIGPELYYDLLQEAIHKYDNKKLSDFDIDVDLEKSIYIPEDYIKNPGTRIEFYRKIADIETNADFFDLKTEMIDRFGNLPQSIENLFEIVKIKQECRTYGICFLKMQKKSIKIKFATSKVINFEKLMLLINTNKSYKIYQDNIIEIVGDFSCDKINIKKLVEAFCIC